MQAWQIVLAVVEHNDEANCSAGHAVQDEHSPVPEVDLKVLAGQDRHEPSLDNPHPDR